MSDPSTLEQSAIIKTETAPHCPCFSPGACPCFSPGTMRDQPPPCSPDGKRRSRKPSYCHSDTIGDLPPSMRVQFILGEDPDQPGQQISHPILSEVGEFNCELGSEGEWKETARWVKFEEDVEENGNRWTKPFVGTLSLHALFQLRSYLLNGTLFFDIPAISISDVVNTIVDDLIANRQLDEENRDKVIEVLLRPHRHVHELQRSTSILLGKTKPPNSSSKILTDLTESRSKVGLNRQSLSTLASEPSNLELRKGNSNLMKKLPSDTEVTNVLVGQVDFLDKPISAFVRLANASILGDLTEVPVPTRFVFVLLGPKGELEEYREVGRVVATLMSDEVFREVAYRAKHRDHLLAGVDEFMDAVTVLPPGEWDPAIRIEPPDKVPSQEQRKNPDKPPEVKEDPEVEEMEFLKSQGLVRTGRFFGGLIDDVKRKAPFYKSDFVDAFAYQSLASITFLYFASLSTIITFGGLLGDATENRLAALESLCAGCICGIISSLFAGQPLALPDATGPVLVFEGILYDFCKKNGFNYLALRSWVGLWIGVFMIILCAFEMSAVVAFITRFTEENFALLIATIYIYKAFEEMMEISHDYPLDPPITKVNATDCFCVPHNDTMNETFWKDAPFNWIGQSTNSCQEVWNGTLVGEDCFEREWYPNVFFMSVLLTTFTFFLCVILKGMKRTPYFSFKVRSLISDFGVFIAICSMTAIDYFIGIQTPKIHVPRDFKPTWEERGWIINPIHPDNPWWIIPGTMLPAALATILLFLDQQITAVIVNRRENKLRKGCGYHLDLFVLAILTALMGFMGLPWLVAGTVICINHINSLKVESETAAPGDKPLFLGVREQRLTQFFIFLLVGLSVFMVPVLKFIPMPVLYGIFLYMGTAPLSEMHFFNRIRIICIPPKYQPDYIYLRKVPLLRVHLFTFVQLCCFAFLWVVKTNETISISFPLMLVIMIFIRKALDYVFSKDELRVLDSIIPPIRMKPQNTCINPSLDSAESSKPESSNGIPCIINQNKPLTKRSSSVNISNEVVKSGVWIHVNQRNAPFRTIEEKENELKSYRKKDYTSDDEELQPLTISTDGAHKSH